MTIDEILFPLDLIPVWKVYYIMCWDNPAHCFDIRVNSEQWGTEIANIGEDAIFDYWADGAFDYWGR